MPEYADAYPELSQLVQLIRSYLVAVRLTHADHKICETIKALPFSDAERVAVPLPDYRQSDLFIDIGSYNYLTPRGPQKVIVSASSASGGVSISGKRVYWHRVAPGADEKIAQLENSIQSLDTVPWTESGDRRLFAFLMTDPVETPDGNVPSGQFQINYAYLIVLTLAGAMLSVIFIPSKKSKQRKP
jgi:hypothetical protein